MVFSRYCLSTFLFIVDPLFQMFLAVRRWALAFGELITLLFVYIPYSVALVLGTADVLIAIHLQLLVQCGKFVAVYYNKLFAGAAAAAAAAAVCVHFLVCAVLRVIVQRSFGVHSRTVPMHRNGCI